MIVLLPLEPFESRYTADWYRWFPNEFSRLGVEYVQIDGQKITDKIECGSVLDIYGTSVWKNTQLANLISEMRLGNVTSKDTLLIADAWYPSLECLEYIKCQGGHHPRIAGILHAGTWDDNDFTVRTGMRPIFHGIEDAWLKMIDIIFVATEHHKRLILQNHKVGPNKIHVTGLPFYPDEFTKPRLNMPKIGNYIVFPHRLDIEKDPNEFDAVIKQVMKHRTVFASKTAEMCVTKSDYYDELAKASIAISLAKQETFGYAMLEATALGCIPIVPNRLSYVEMYPDELRYNTISELPDLIIDVLDNLEKYREYTLKAGLKHQKYQKSISEMVKIIEGL